MQAFPSKGRMGFDFLTCSLRSTTWVSMIFALDTELTDRTDASISAPSSTFPIRGPTFQPECIGRLDRIPRTIKKRGSSSCCVLGSSLCDSACLEMQEDVKCNSKGRWHRRERDRLCGEDGCSATDKEAAGTTLAGSNIASPRKRRTKAQKELEAGSPVKVQSAEQRLLRLPPGTLQLLSRDCHVRHKV